MTSARSYRPAFTQEAAVAELRRGAGIQFAPEVVDAFVAALEASGTVYGALRTKESIRG